MNERPVAHALIGVVGLLAIEAWGCRNLPSPLPTADSLDRLPSWSYSDFESAVRREVDPEGKNKTLVRVLAWSTQQDDRILRVDTVLAWAHVVMSAKNRWALALMYRHPSVAPEWWASRKDDVAWEPIEFYEHPPSNSEIYSFLDSVPGHRPFFESMGQDFFILSAGVRSRTWTAVTGQRPTRFYPTESAVE
jgi:hypothetical protein